MKTFFLRFFTWWNGATFGTLLTTSLYGEFVGEDEFGNCYYRTKGGKIDPALGFERRWVIYNGVAEASSIPSSWHGWMHHTVDVPPTQETVVPRPWWKPHRPNLTGTPGAHRPTGSTLAQGRRPKATGDYKAWSPRDAAAAALPPTVGSRSGCLTFEPTPVTREARRRVIPPLIRLIPRVNRRTGQGIPAAL